MPKWWQKRYKHIREENPKMPEGMEYALATEQYKKEFGHPPKLHHHKKKSELFTELLQLADKLDEKGLRAEADLIDKAWFDPKVLERSERMPLSRSENRSDQPTEKNYCFNCGAPIATLESKCPACNYESASAQSHEHSI